eukprot:TRINITY_DN797_c0_g1_i17.p1 TRINITY_DN797_c0_g1~~TRINITY_DN797_c0_g1_i17.p1  ORF type:complete len:236 (+),score=48.10 TRINITY_DN797_c0_g1_i17:116-823(+)
MGHKKTIEMTPNRTFSSALSEFCKDLKFDAGNYDLVHTTSSKTLPTSDLTIPWRLCGYPARTTFNVQKKRLNLPSDVEVNVALQLPPEYKSEKLIRKFLSNTRLWDVLSFWEVERGINITKRVDKQGTKEVYMQPVVRFISNEIGTCSDLQRMTLADIGLAQRSGVLTVQHRCTGLSLNEYFDQQVRLHEQLKLNPNKSVPAKDLEEARKERELERESKETMELQFQFRFFFVLQ